MGLGVLVLTGNSLKIVVFPPTGHSSARVGEALSRALTALDVASGGGRAIGD